MCSINIDICGKRGAGKSSLLSRFIAGTFNEGVRETNGVHMGIKKILLDNISINLYLWDSKMYNKTENYEASNFRSVDGFLFVFDCTDKDAMDEVVEWQEMLKKEGQDHIPKLLLGNKCDEEYARTETNLTAFQTADDYGMKYFEVSAKEDSQVELSFLSLVALILRKKSLV